MKKLMIAAAIACVVAISQAANCAWNSDCFGFQGMDAENKFDNYTYNYALICLGDEAVAASAISYDGATVKINGAALDSSAILDSGDGVDGWGASGNIGDKVIAGNYYTVVVFSNDANLYGIGEITAAAMSSVPGATDFESMHFANTKFEVYGTDMVDGIMASQAVPEPTSGLLLLLGVAGLALRRRRA